MVNDIADWYEKYGPMVFRRCRKMLQNEDNAKDAVQDVFLKLLKTRGKTVSCPSSYLYTAATKVCLNRIRANKQYAGLADDIQEFPDYDGRLEEIDAEMLVQVLLQDDDEGSRTICYLRYFDGMSLEEIGENMGMSKITIEKRLVVFKNRVLLKLEKDNT
jgi:RNA polymerase sigma-70 factor (ECF subfamily)